MAAMSPSFRRRARVPASTGRAERVERAGGTEPAAAPSETDMRQLENDRRALIELCLYAIDRARSGGVAGRLEEGLAGVGVTAVRPDGARFDPGVHEAGGTVPTVDPMLDGVIAETEVAGFVDGETVLRVPVVTVYTVDGSAAR
ncbi:nucleotide exchange factor GrpE [Haloechinothrix alba]|uniref:nucleotide exchange factor GrpE n=1 Tax=Haloechinothrix alba TaxID=664784 RepID=UPI0011313951